VTRLVEQPHLRFALKARSDQVEAFDQDADVRFQIKHDVPIFNHPFSKIAKDYVELQKQHVEAGQIAPTA
jgi:hypothetical protein